MTAAHSTALSKLPSDVGEWPAALSALNENARWELGRAILHEWIEGRLEPRFLAGPADRATLARLRRSLASAVSACGSNASLEVENHQLGFGEAAVRRWCWIEPWILIDQDEDLMLMEDSLVAPLLDEAAAGCPKRDYVISIVEHHLRDQVHAALRKDWAAFRARVTESSAYVESARTAGAPHLVEYLNRLVEHAKPQKVSREQAIARVADSWRCHAPEPGSIRLEPVGGEWHAPMTEAHARRETLVIDSKTGAMHIAPSGPRGKKGR